MATGLTLDILLPEQAKILSHSPQAGGYVLLRLFAPQCAAHAQPGTQVRLISNNSALIPIAALLRAEGRAGWIEILYPGTSAIPSFNIGALMTLSIVPGPVFTLPNRSCPLLIGDAAGTAPTVFMADKLRQKKNLHPLILLGYDTAPPFIAAPSRILVSGMPNGVIAAMPLLEDWGMPSRLAHSQERPGFFEGSVYELARFWLDTLSSTQCAETEIIVSGSSALIDAVTALAHQHQMPCQALPLVLE